MVTDGLTFTGYNLDGEKAWTSQAQDAWGFYSTGWTVAYGKLTLAAMAASTAMT